MNRLERWRADTSWECTAEDVTAVRARGRVWLVVETTAGAETFRSLVRRLPRPGSRRPCTPAATATARPDDLLALRADEARAAKEAQFGGPAPLVARGGSLGTMALRRQGASSAPSTAAPLPKRSESPVVGRARPGCAHSPECGPRRPSARSAPLARRYRWPSWPSLRRHAGHFRPPASRCQRSSVAGVTREARQPSRGRIRLRAATQGAVDRPVPDTAVDLALKGQHLVTKTPSSTSLSASPRRHETTNDKSPHSPSCRREKATAHDGRLWANCQLKALIEIVAPAAVQRSNPRLAPCRGLAPKRRCRLQGASASAPCAPAVCRNDNTTGKQLRRALVRKIKVKGCGPEGPTPATRPLQRLPPGPVVTPKATPRRGQLHTVSICS